MIRSTFASFTTARLAIQASQNALAIVGQNMANVKTNGYTRQRLDQVSLNSQGITSVYQANPDAHIGYGVMVTGVSQIRDPFLDARYRAEMGNLGAIDKKVDILTKMSQVLDGTDKTSWKDQLNDLEKQLKTLMADTSSNSNDSLVRSSMQTLVGVFNQYSHDLSKVKEQAVTDADNSITNVNNLLKQIKELNISIKDTQVHGNSALELQDQRNLLIDELSTYVDIRVTHTTDVTMIGTQVDNLRIDMVGSSALGSDVINLIDDNKTPAEFSMNYDSDDGTYNMTVKDVMSVPHMEVSSSKGTLGTALSMLNDNGEFGNPPTLNRGIGYYQSSIDNLAKTFAETFNKLNVVYDKDGVAKEYPLFASSDPHNPAITASNITLASGWLNGDYKLVVSQEPNASSETSNILNMINALSSKQNFKTSNNTNAFSGTFYECFDNIVNTLAVDSKASNNILDNYLSVTSEIADSKDSVSGVSLDEEGMNLMQYNSSLTAASRLMTTLDEALNTIINSMGIVGR